MLNILRSTLYFNLLRLFPWYEAGGGREGHEQLFDDYHKQLYAELQKKSSPRSWDMTDYVVKLRAKSNELRVPLDLSDEILTGWGELLVKEDNDILRLARFKEMEAIFVLDEDEEERAALQLASAYVLISLKRYHQALRMIDDHINSPHNNISYTARYLDFTTRMKTGSVPPDFKNQIVDGRGVGSEFQLSAQKGRVVILEFWQTWCEPCHDKLAELEKIERKFSNHVIVIGISDLRNEDSGSDILALRKKLGITLAQVNDEGGVSDSYYVTTYPHCIVVGPNGHVAAYRPEEDLSALVQLLISERK